eukprot:CAMPEP_0175960062 /NCGR_PEP_ID=MMETSP0108-20121206/35154_1 /TAXON_ID=195067 ORGANISM="Goniomonas pacifica, Strain CCMP1869" /NCGR_SAMPLE_ID=MMETSP0108 /ASSEMBLY_ACC=CAM_ASM_000204 /LENGTH=363 /DNA_ID=CAMNT_0017287605 /DNA_START=24 /DNA_END=1113 /DNA_ORIENTATION=-
MTIADATPQTWNKEEFQTKMSDLLSLGDSNQIAIEKVAAGSVIVTFVILSSAAQPTAHVDKRHALEAAAKNGQLNKALPAVIRLKIGGSDVVIKPDPDAPAPPPKAAAPPPLTPVTSPSDKGANSADNHDTISGQGGSIASEEDPIASADNPVTTAHNHAARSDVATAASTAPTTPVVAATTSLAPETAMAQRQLSPQRAPAAHIHHNEHAHTIAGDGTGGVAVGPRVGAPGATSSGRVEPGGTIAHGDHRHTVTKDSAGHLHVGPRAPGSTPQQGQVPVGRGQNPASWQQQQLLRQQQMRQQQMRQHPALQQQRNRSPVRMPPGQARPAQQPAMQPAPGARQGQVSPMRRPGPTGMGRGGVS